LPSTAFLVGAYLDVASAAVVEMGGKVAKKLGDGLMALFGYPVAQENDAEWAVRAALAIQRALSELNGKNAGTGKPVLAARIAIDFRAGGGGCIGRNIRRRAKHRGPGAGAGRAGRGRGHGAGARQIAGLFVAEERGSHELKGVPEPVTLFRLVRASGGGRRSGSAISPRWSAATSPLNVSGPETSACARWRSAAPPDFG
jgi:class 3 adenylate cyclase